MTSADTDQSSYPTRVEDVTADRLCRYLTGVALVRARRIEELTPAVLATPADSPECRRFKAENGAFVAEYAIVLVLREMNQIAADEYARQIWQAWQDGAHMEEMLREWADGYGQPSEPGQDDSQTEGSGRQ